MNHFSHSCHPHPPGGRTFFLRLVSLLLCAALLTAGFLPALAAEPDTAPPLTAAELRQEMIRLNGPIAPEWIPIHTVGGAVDTVLAHDESFTRWSEAYQVPKALVQTVVLRELICCNVFDLLGDFLAEFWFQRCGAAERNGAEGALKAFSWLFKKDSSTGAGQIIADTAILANNMAVERGILPADSRVYDVNDWHDRADMWRRLRDDTDFNIQMVTLALILFADPPAPYEGLLDLTDDQAQAIFRSYTGTVVMMNAHLYYCGEYYLLFRRYNASLTGAADSQRTEA
ncbi:MAG: hypothetical protein LBJ11_03915 [Oscillospiraceae bacterium]|jgi:hypothetical protein|nr:hypothetical protein [Oscillospiraceae bacterium]